jgi:hypothetical protein
MSEVHAAGKFKGRIISTEFEQDGQEPDGLVLVFTVKLDDGEIVTCKHRTHGKFSHICKNIITALDLSWPKGVLEIDSLVGREVPVSLKHKDGKSGNVFVNAYLDLGGGGNAPADKELAAKLVAKMSGEVDDSDIPF